MKTPLLPAIWLIVLIVGLPLLSETVYTPALPTIAQTLSASAAQVEYTLTIYLLGFAIGTLFWGKQSDQYGRKPCVLIGLGLFTLGSVACYHAPTIELLLLARFIQAFGGSIGSVLGQAICRDAFQGKALGRVYASVGSALAFFPAIGPIVGGLILENYGWRSILLVLSTVALLLTAIAAWYLPETHDPGNRTRISTRSVMYRLLTDKKVLCLGLIVAACNGIQFSYYAEGAFYLIDLIGLSPSQYGLSFIAIACATMLGGLCSKKLQNHHSAQQILGFGLVCIFIASALFSLLMGLGGNGFSSKMLVGITIVLQMGIMFGVCIAASNALALALVDYKDCIGTASSLFGFFYYSLVSVCTFVMALLHNHSLATMPIFFLTLGGFMLLIKKSPLR